MQAAAGGSECAGSGHIADDRAAAGKESFLTPEIELAIAFERMAFPVDRREVVPDAQHGWIAESVEQFEDGLISGFRAGLQRRTRITGWVSGGFVQAHAAEQQGVTLTVADRSTLTGLQRFMAMPDFANWCVTRRQRHVHHQQRQIRGVAHEDRMSKEDAAQHPGIFVLSQPGELRCGQDFQPQNRFCRRHRHVTSSVSSMV